MAKPPPYTQLIFKFSLHNWCFIVANKKSGERFLWGCILYVRDSNQISPSNLYKEINTMENGVLNIPYTSVRKYLMIIIS